MTDKQRPSEIDVDRLSELIIDSTYNVSLDTNLEARFKVVPVALSQSTDDPTSASGSPRTIQFQRFFKLFHNIFSSPFPWKFEYTISVNTLFTKSVLVSSLSSSYLDIMACFRMLPYSRTATNSISEKWSFIGLIQGEPCH